MTVGVSSEQSLDELETKLILRKFSQEGVILLGPCPGDPLWNWLKILVNVYAGSEILLHSDVAGWSLTPAGQGRSRLSAHIESSPILLSPCAKMI